MIMQVGREDPDSAAALDKARRLARPSVHRNGLASPSSQAPRDYPVICARSRGICRVAGVPARAVTVRAGNAPL